MQNEMMFRPVIDKNILEFMRQAQPQLTGKLGELERNAHERNVPVIPHETVVFLQFYLRATAPKTILEIGTAIGFSASLMAETLPSAHITTLERAETMANEAKQTFKKFGLEKQITLIEGQASEILPTLAPESFDFIFMDSAKAKYIEFLPYCLKVLTEHGTIMIDDVFQAGTILQPESEIPRKNRSIHRHLNELFETIHRDETLFSTILPLGDGVLLVQKIK